MHLLAAFESSKLLAVVILTKAMTITTALAIFLILLYLSIFLFDLVYSVLLHVKSKEQGINPWKRAYDNLFFSKFIFNSLSKCQGVIYAR